MNQLIGCNVIIRPDGSNFTQAILCSMLNKSLYKLQYPGTRSYIEVNINNIIFMIIVVIKQKLNMEKKYLNHKY